STDPAADGAARAAGSPWLVGGILLVVLALLGGWFLRRRSAARAPVFRAPDPARRDSPLAAAFPDQGAKTPAPGNAPSTAGQPAGTAPVRDETRVAASDKGEVAAAETPIAGKQRLGAGEGKRPAAPVAPAWHAGAGAAGTEAG